jgi:hypothetical protein
MKNFTSRTHLWSTTLRHHKIFTWWRWVLPERRIVSQIVKESPAFYRTRKFVTVTAYHWSLSWARWIQSTASHPVSLTSIFRCLLPIRPRSCVTRCLLFYGEELAQRPAHKLEDHTLSAVRYCLFNIFTATLRIWRPSPPPATRGRAIPWW